MEYGEYCWYSSWTRSTPNLKINNPSKIWRGLVPIHKFFLTNQILDSYRWIYMEGKIQKFPISCHGGKKGCVESKIKYLFSASLYSEWETKRENCLHASIVSNSWTKKLEFEFMMWCLLLRQEKSDCYRVSDFNSEVS